MPHEPDRRRLEGASYVHDPARYALLQAGTAYLLPALDPGGEAALSAALAEAPCEPVRDVNGQDVAMACRLAPLSLTYMDQPAQRVSANLDNQIEVVGYTLTDWRLEPGGQVSLALGWKAQQDIGADYRLFVHLIDPRGSVLAYGDTKPGMGTYPTTYWRSGETVPTFHRLSVPADLPPGRYEIEVGFYHPLSLRRLPVVRTSGEVLAQRVLIGPLKVPLPVASDVPISNHPFRLGEAIQLAGYEVVGQGQERWAAKAGDVVHLRLAWAALDRPAADYTVFVHLSALDERILAQHDGQPLDGTYPTSIWERGEVIVEDIALTIAGDAAPGTYRFWVGMYDPLHNQRLPVFDVAGEQQPDDRALIGELYISGNGP